MELRKGIYLSLKSKNLQQTLKPLGFVLATGLNPLFSETAAHVSECLRLSSAPNRLMSLMQELLSEMKL
jgi:hypothetical protein